VFHLSHGSHNIHLHFPPHIISHQIHAACVSMGVGRILFFQRVVVNFFPGRISHIGIRGYNLGRKNFQGRQNCFDSFFEFQKLNDPAFGTYAPQTKFSLRVKGGRQNFYSLWAASTRNPALRPTVLKFNFINSQIREKDIFTKTLIGKYQISKSRGPRPLLPSLPTPMSVSNTKKHLYLQNFNKM